MKGKSEDEEERTYKTIGQAKAYKASEIPEAKAGCGGVDSAGHRVCIMLRQSRKVAGRRMKRTR